MEQATVVYVVEMTEHERGWGQRPDGFMAFATEEQAKAYVKGIMDKRLKETCVPDEYTSYDLLGYRECSANVLARVLSGAPGSKYIHRIGNLKD